MIPYTFKATLHHAWDGDTLWLNIDRGEGWESKGKYRLYGVDTPEIRGHNVSDQEKAYAVSAKKFVESWLYEKRALIINTKRGKSKYDWLVEVWMTDINDNRVSLADLLILNGHGVPYFGGGKLDWTKRRLMQDKARSIL